MIHRQGEFEFADGKLYIGSTNLTRKRALGRFYERTEEVRRDVAFREAAQKRNFD